MYDERRIKEQIEKLEDSVENPNNFDLIKLNTRILKKLIDEIQSDKII